MNLPWDPRALQNLRDIRSYIASNVIPAKAGIHASRRRISKTCVDLRLRGDDVADSSTQIRSFAGRINHDGLIASIPLN